MIKTKLQPKGWKEIIKYKKLPKWSFWLFVVISFVLIGCIDFQGASFTGKIFDGVLSFLNSNSGAVQGLSMIVLVVITGFYAIQTHKTNSLISMQTFPNIFIQSSKLYSGMLNSDCLTNGKKNIQNKKDIQYAFHFSLDYSVLNHSASQGSIERPKLLIENPESGKRKYLSPEIDTVVMSPLKGEIKNTIYLRAGEMKSMNEEFYFLVACANPSDVDMDFINNASLLQYTILYKNITGTQFSILLAKEDVVVK